MQCTIDDAKYEKIYDLIDLDSGDDVLRRTIDNTIVRTMPDVQNVS